MSRHARRDPPDLFRLDTVCNVIVSWCGRESVLLTMTPAPPGRILRMRSRSGDRHRRSSMMKTITSPAPGSTVKSALVGMLLLGSLLAPWTLSAAASTAGIPLWDAGGEAGGGVLGVQQAGPVREHLCSLCRLLPD